MIRKHILLRSLLLSAFVSGSTSSYANYVGNPTNQFVPPAGEREFVTVHSAKMLGKNRFSLGLFGNAAINTLPIFNRVGEKLQDRSSIYDLSIFVEPGVAYGVTDWLQFGFGAPHLVSESVADQEDYRGEFLRAGSIEYHLSSKIRLFTLGDLGIASVFSTNINQLKDDPYSQGVEQRVYNTQLVASYTNFGYGLTANAGYRYFNSENIPDDEVENIEPVSDQFIWSLGGYYAFHRQHRVIGELMGAQLIYPRKETSDRETKSSEARLSYRYTYYQLAFTHGVGTELQHGIGTPSWRFYTGVKWQLPGRFDGVVFPKKKREAPVIKENTPPLLPDTGHSVGVSQCKPQPDVLENAIVGTSLSYETPIREFVLNDIRFRFDSDDLIFSTHNRTIVDFANFIKSEVDFKKIVVIGHADSVGKRSYNQNLSLRRANSVKRFLVLTNNIPANLIEARGEGESNPVASNRTASGRAKNRRVVIQIF